MTRAQNGSLSTVFGALVSALAIVGALWWTQRPALASATITVTTCTNAGVQMAIDSASPGDRIVFSCADPTILIDTTLTVTTSLEIDGANLSGAGPVVLDGGGSTRIMTLSGGVALTLTNITLQRGNAANRDGGAVFGDDTTVVALANTSILSNAAAHGGGVRAGAATITASNIVSNTAGNHGGGIWTNGAVTVFRSAFVSNVASGGQGGGVRAGGPLAVTDTEVARNRATTHGGGIWTNSAATITGALFVSNTAGTNGGGLWAQGATTVTATSLVSNTATFGGGIFTNGPAVITATQFVSNVATTGVGGGLRASGAITVVDTEVARNRAVQNGGGLWTLSAATITGGQFVSNTAGNQGGGLFASTRVSVAGAQFLSNTASSSGGGFWSTGAATVTTSSFTGNVATVAGGGLYASSAAIVTSTQFVSNTAGQSGGGLFANSTAAIADSQFLSNTATVSGGGGVSANSTTTVRDTRFAGNTTGGRGGGLSVWGVATVTGTQFLANTADLGGGLASHTAVTVSGGGFLSNTAGTGGAVAAFSGLTLTNSTLSANTALTSGGAISLAASSPVSVSLAYVTVVSNTAPDAAIAARVAQTGTVHGVVVQQGATGANCQQVTFPGATGLVATDTSCGNTGATSAASIALGPLANNGGPTLPGGQPTLTHLPASTSALVAGVACLPGVPTDQRGFARPGYSGATCDIGAVQTVPTMTLTSLTPNTAPAGSPATVVTVTGSGFVPFLTQALVNGLVAPTTVVSTTQLSVTIDAASLAAAGALTVSAQYGADVSTRSNSLPFTVTLTSQTVTFPNPGNQNPTSFPANLPVTATATSGLPVTLTSQTALVCTVSGFTVSLLTPGLCTLVANQGGNAAFAPASPVTQTFVVSLLTQTITFPNPGNQNPTSFPTTLTVTATASSGLPVTLTSQTASVCTVSGFTVSLLAGGTCTLVANQGGNTTYAPASPVTQSFAVGRLSQTIPTPQLPATPTPGQIITLPQLSSRGLPVVYTSLTPSVCTVSGNVVTPVGAGTCRIQATQPGNAQVAPAEPRVFEHVTHGSNVSQQLWLWFPQVTVRNAAITAPSPFDVLRVGAPGR